LDLHFHVHASHPSVLRILPPAIYVRTRLTCRLVSVDTAAGEACFQKPYQDILHHLDSTYVPSAGLLACSPSAGGLGRRTAERAGCCPLRWGCWAVSGRAHRLLPPSSGSILSGTSLKFFQRSYLGTIPKFLQRSQQLVWVKLPSSTYMSREVHPMNILTPPHSTLAVCWISAHQPIIFFLCLSKSVLSSGFVNMSAICSPVATWYMLTVPFLTSSLK
jgi:hypothetical protein